MQIVKYDKIILTAHASVSCSYWRVSCTKI